MHDTTVYSYPSLASFPGHLQLFNVLKGWEWSGDKLKAIAVYKLR